VTHRAQTELTPHGLGGDHATGLHTGPIIDDDHLELGPGQSLRSQAGQQTLEPRRPIAGRDDH
jgi:hypothetical protein